MAWLDTWVFPLGSVLLGGLGLLALVRGLLGRRFMVRRTRRCRRCRYDMTATAGHTCPECGHTARHEGEHYAGRRRWLVAAMGLVLLVGAGLGAMTPGVRREGWLRLLPLELQARLFHLETNEAAYGALVEQLHVSRGFGGGGRAPGFGPGSMLPTIEPERMNRLEPVLHRAAVRNLRRPKPSQRAVVRSFAMIEGYTRGLLTDDERLALVESFGVQHRSIQQLLAWCEIAPGSALAQARRDAFEVADSNHRNALGWSMVRFPGGEKDAPMIGVWLATPEHDGDPGSEHATSRIRNDAGGSVPDGALPVYAALVRAEGACGNFKTLAAAATRSPAVASAAVDWTLSLGKGAERDRWIGVLADVRPSYDAAAIDADWSVARAEAEAEPKLYNEQDLMRLMRSLDAGMSGWLIRLAQDHGSPHRETAMYELRGMRHGRQEAIDFAFGEGWRDETLSLNARMWPLVYLESWYGSAIPTHTDLAAYWGEVLERASDGHQDAFEEGLWRFRRGTYGQSAFALVAVGRRLLETGMSEPWLPRLAAEIAKSHHRDPSIRGFIEVLRLGPNAWTYIGNHSAIPGEEARSLADRLEAKFGGDANDPADGQP